MMTSIQLKALDIQTSIPRKAPHIAISILRKVLLMKTSTIPRGATRLKIE